MRKSLWVIPVLLLFFGAIGAPAAKADTITSDLGAGYQCCIGWTVSGATSSVGAVYDVASQFTSSGNYAVTQIDLGIGYVNGTNGATVELTTDNSGVLGTVLGSWNVSSLPVFGASSTALTTISGITGLDISAGTYFLVVLPGASDTWDAWNYNSTGALGLNEYSASNQYPGSTDPAYDVLGSPIASTATPEPSSILLLGVGLVGLMFIGRKRFAADSPAQS